MASKVVISPLMNPMTRPVEALSHAQKVCRFYKQVIKDIQARTGNAVVPYRLQAVRMRKQFDENKNLSFNQAKEVLAQAEVDFKKIKYPSQFYYANSPGGCAFDRSQPTPDWLLDTWHPLEKAQYPKYFALRDVRKREFIERYEAKYGTQTEPAH